MGCSFQVIAAFLAIFMIAPASLAHASDFCLPRNDKQKIDTVERYFDTSLQAHEKRTFARPMIRKFKDRAKTILVQKILDKQSQICGDQLKLVEDLKNEPKHWTSGECASDATIGVMDAYMKKIAQYFDENQKELLAQQNEHMHDLRAPLIEIAKGSSVGLEGVTVKGQPIASVSKEARMAWVKEEAERLVTEAKTAWGSKGPEKNPMVLQNMVIAREAIRARNERDSLKTRLRADGVLASSCVRKP